MPQYVIIDIAPGGVRMVGATTQGREGSLRHVAWIPCEAGEVRDRVGEALAAWKWSKPLAILLVPRTGCELRCLTLPQVPDDDLPDMVRLQAMQHFAAIGEETPLDFLPTVRGTENVVVLAAATTGDHLPRGRALLEKAGCTVEGAYLRACGTAALVDRTEGDATPVRLVLDLLGDRAELLVADRATVVLARSVRLSAGGETDHQGHLIDEDTIVSESLRTIAAAQTQLDGSRVGHVIVTGDDPARQALVAKLAQATQLPANCLDPFSAIPAGDGLATEDPSQRGAFAALLGAALDPLNTRGSALDFLRPRRRPQPTSRRPLWTTVALVAATVLLLAGGLLWQRLASADDQIARLRRQIAETDKLVEVAQRQQREVEAIDEWYATSPNWLVELRQLSERLPPSHRLRLQQLQAERLNEGGGKITIKGYVDGPVTVAELEVALRDAQRSVTGLDRNYVGEDGRYPWYFMEELRIAPEPAEEDATEESSP